MDLHAVVGPRRSRLVVLLLLGAVAVGALVVAGLSSSRPERAGPPAPSEGSAGIAAGAEQPPEEDTPPDRQRVANGPDGARARTAAELTEALVAEVMKAPRSQDVATIASLRDLLREKSEPEILAAAATLLECGSMRGAQVASTLALGVLGGEGRRITDDEAFAILGETVSRMLAEAGAEPGDVLVVSNAMLGGQILAAIGTPQATELLLDCASEFGSPLSDLVASVRNPASVPLLFQTIASRTDLNLLRVAFALSRSADGRAELRRLLDPAGGFGWAGHAEARVAAMRVLATDFRDDEDLAAIDAALRERPDLANTVSGAMAQHGRVNPVSDAGLILPTKTEQAKAVVAFLAGHAGSALEPSLLAILGRFPERIVDPLLPRLEAARPGMRDRVVAARTPAK